MKKIFFQREFQIMIFINIVDALNIMKEKGKTDFDK